MTTFTSILLNILDNSIVNRRRRRRPPPPPPALHFTYDDGKGFNEGDDIGDDGHDDGDGFQRTGAGARARASNTSGLEETILSLLHHHGKRNLAGCGLHVRRCTRASECAAVHEPLAQCEVSFLLFLLSSLALALAKHLFWVAGSYDVTTIGGYTQDGNPEGMVTIDLSNFIQVQQDRQQERIEALKQAGIEIPPGADQLASVPESLSYVVKCENDAFSKLVVQSPAGGCQDIALKGTGDRIIPAQSFVAKMICEQISPLAAFKSQCESWEPSGDGATEQGKDCTGPTLKDSIQNQAATIEASTLSVEQTSTYQPDASNPDLFTTAEADTKSKVRSLSQSLSVSLNFFF